MPHEIKGLNEECGVFGVFDTKKANQLTYFGYTEEDFQQILPGSRRAAGEDAGRRLQGRDAQRRLLHDRRDHGDRRCRR